jgi:enoyl-CoA hydratase/carnithine racemase
MEMGEAVKFERAGAVGILRLDHGVTNPISTALVEALDEHLSSAQTDARVKALVLTSLSEKFFSIGFDIPGLIDLPQADFRTFYERFNQTCLSLYTFPKPVIVALPGHAIAGGYILALCCDMRLIASGKKLVGLNEIKLGVPVPYPADCILRSIVGARIGREVTDRGEFYPAAQALEFGMVDRVLPLDEVIPCGIEEASMLAGRSRGAYAQIKDNRVAPVVGEIEARLAEKQRGFIEDWYGAEARRALRAAMEKF